MHLSSLIIISLPMALCQKQCAADNCYRAVLGTFRGAGQTSIAHTDCVAFQTTVVYLTTTTTTMSGNIDTIISPTAPTPTQVVPKYATACNPVSRYASACSCAGVTAALATSTLTVSVVQKFSGTCYYGTSNTGIGCNAGNFLDCGNRGANGAACWPLGFFNF